MRNEVVDGIWGSNALRKKIECWMSGDAARPEIVVARDYRLQIADFGLPATESSEE